ncbi:PKD domain-containing protein [Micromonospora siamensis]|uniref:Right handed beta helix region n=1 Tax=Micromonospora siamensis TaxID=299152 RepID=A0A1C5GZ27_9ACTN|nr:PKD domain-containing protein [Micromonospora siamensis]SCG39010.1 Right handed beta helix region [Micromonospora siamensis]
MRRPTLAGLTALAVTGGTLLSTTAAQAADVTTLYVAQTSISCSDSGPGNTLVPFCTIGAAAAVVQAGQTVAVGSGVYRERVTVPRSGTPDQPITIRSNLGTRIPMGGGTAGFVVDGQHDIVIQGFSVGGSVDVPALELRNASAVTVDNFIVGMGSKATAPAVRLSGVTGSTLQRLVVSGQALTNGLTMDATTSGVTVQRSTFQTNPYYEGTAATSVAVRVAGTGNTVARTRVDGFAGGAISVEPGASGTTLVNNLLTTGGGYGIRNDSATGTTITNNTVKQRCNDGIRVEGASTGVDVWNNVLTDNGWLGLNNCNGKQDGVEIGVYGDTARDTTVDYNDVFHTALGSSKLYSFGGARLGLTSFRTASGQGAHDHESSTVVSHTDSANSAAKGYPSIDIGGVARTDDMGVPNTGVGPVTYADRGAVENFRYPTAVVSATLDLGTVSATADASASVPGTSAITSYRFDFGDGTVVTQSTPVATHKYANPGTYTVMVDVTDSDGRTNATNQMVSVLRRIGTISLLARSNLKYVAPTPAGEALRADHYGVDSVDKFDLADVGSGGVALYSRSANRYVSTTGAGALVTLVYPHIESGGRFSVVPNTNGTISLFSRSTNLYLSTSCKSGAVCANNSSIGTFEQFHRVDVTNANRTFKARSNARYVTASNTAATPLAATATGVGVAQKYDLVNLGNYQWALFARANNRFVTASLGTQPLINTKTIPGTWERFVIVHNSDGSVSLRSTGNNRYVTADSTKPLIANAGTIGPRQQYTLG